MANDTWADPNGKPELPHPDRHVVPDDEGGAAWWKGGKTISKQATTDIFDAAISPEPKPTYSSR